MKLNILVILIEHWWHKGETKSEISFFSKIKDIRHFLSFWIIPINSVLFLFVVGCMQTNPSLCIYFSGFWLANRFRFVEYSWMFRIPVKSWPNIGINIFKIEHTANSSPFSFLSITESLSYTCRLEDIPRRPLCFINTMRLYVKFYVHDWSWISHSTKAHSASSLLSYFLINFLFFPFF